MYPLSHSSSFVLSKNRITTRLDKSATTKSNYVTQFFFNLIKRTFHDSKYDVTWLLHCHKRYRVFRVLISTSNPPIMFCSQVIDTFFSKCSDVCIHKYQSICIIARTEKNSCAKSRFFKVRCQEQDFFPKKNSS